MSDTVLFFYKRCLEGEKNIYMATFSHATEASDCRNWIIQTGHEIVLETPPVTYAKACQLSDEITQRANQIEGVQQIC